MNSKNTPKLSSQQIDDAYERMNDGTAYSKWVRSMITRQRYVIARQRKSGLWDYGMTARNTEKMSYTRQGFARKSTMIKSIYAEHSPLVHIEFIPFKTSK